MSKPKRKPKERSVKIHLSPITQMFLLHDYIQQYGFPKRKVKKK